MNWGADVFSVWRSRHHVITLNDEMCDNIAKDTQNLLEIAGATPERNELSRSVLFHDFTEMISIDGERHGHREFPGVL